MHVSLRQPFSWLLASLLLCLGNLPLAAQWEQADEPADTRGRTEDRSGHWDVVVVPASINRDRTIRLIGGHTQFMDLMFQASDEITAQPGPYAVELTLDLPPGVRYAHSAAGWPIDTPVRVAKLASDRQQVQIKFAIPQNRLAGKPGQRPISEWRTLGLFVEVAEDVPLESAYMRAHLRHGNHIAQQRWPLRVEPLRERTLPNPKRTTIGLWDYGVHRAGAPAGDGMARFLTATGVNFSQNGSAPGYLDHAKNHGLLIGGNTHHSLFHGSSEQNDIDVRGNVIAGNFPSAARINLLPEGTEIPGARKMVEIAQAQHGMATYDFEPMGGIGFTPEAVALFKEQFGVSDEAFDAFRQKYVELGRSLYMKADEPTLAIYRQWVLFHSQQSAEYVRRVNASARAIWPDIRIAVTPNVGFADDDLATLGYGYNAARMSPHVDVMMPQIYVGYNNAAAKLAMQYTQGWRQAMDGYGAQDKQLWPLILIRYAGASPFNSPARVRQQMIGVLAHGADGLLFYYPGNMDGPYWQKVAQATDEITRYEDFYHDGKRVEDRFPLRDMMQGSAELSRFPAHKVSVENPQWAFTAHENSGETLLTLLNLEDANDILFTVEIPQGLKVKEAAGIESYGLGQWLVSPGDIGYVVLTEE